MIELEIVPVNTVPNDEFNIMFNNLRAHLQIHNIQMMNNAFENQEEGATCQIELTKGKCSAIEVCRVPGINGNCLFTAIVHQHHHFKMDSNELTQKVSDLRKEVVEHIRAHIKEFKREIFGRIYAKSRDGDKKTKIQDLEIESTKFLDNYLSKDGSWGGTESIKAISYLFKANIIVFNEYGEVNCANIFNPSYENVITLAFRVSNYKNITRNLNNTQRNHYDSIIKLSNDVINECASILIVNHTKSCSLKTISNAIIVE